jgi:hypothetical protein
MPDVAAVEIARKAEFALLVASMASCQLEAEISAKAPNVFLWRTAWHMSEITVGSKNWLSSLWPPTSACRPWPAHPAHGAVLFNRGVLDQRPWLMPSSNTADFEQ